MRSFQSPSLIAASTRVSNRLGCNRLPLGCLSGSILCSSSCLGLAVSELFKMYNNMQIQEPQRDLTSIYTLYQ